MSTGAGEKAPTLWAKGGRAGPGSMRDPLRGAGGGHPRGGQVSEVWASEETRGAVRASLRAGLGGRGGPGQGWPALPDQRVPRPQRAPDAGRDAAGPGLGREAGGMALPASLSGELGEGLRAARGAGAGDGAVSGEGRGRSGVQAARGQAARDGRPASSAARGRGRAVSSGPGPARATRGPRGEVGKRWVRRGVGQGLGPRMPRRPHGGGWRSGRGRARRGGAGRDRGSRSRAAPGRSAATGSLAGSPAAVSPGMAGRVPGTAAGSVRGVTAPHADTWADGAPPTRRGSGRRRRLPSVARRPQGSRPIRGGRCPSAGVAARPREPGPHLLRDPGGRRGLGRAPWDPVPPATPRSLSLPRAGGRGLVTAGGT